MSFDVNIYDRRSLSRALIKSKPIEPFIYNTFFGYRESHTEKVVDMEIIEGTANLANFADEEDDAILIRKGTKKIKTITLPMTNEYKLWTLKDIKNFNNIGNIYNNDPALQAERLRQLNAWKVRELDDLRARVMRLREMMCCAAMSEGKIEISQSNIAFTLDYGFVEGTHLITTLEAADQWDVSTGDPGSNIDTWNTAILRRTGKNATHLIMGEEAGKAFLGNAKVKAELDNLNYKIGALTRVNKPTNSGKYIGNVYGLECYIYNQQYVTGSDEDGNYAVANFINPHRAIVCSTDSDNKFHWGPIEEMDAQGNIQKYMDEYHMLVESFPAESQAKKGLKWIMQQCSAPQPDPDSIISALVID